VNEDVDAAVSFEDGAGDVASAVRGAEIGLNVVIRRAAGRCPGAGRRRHDGARGGQARRDRGAHALRAAGDESALARELGRVDVERGRRGHQPISRRAIF
jgi:hypothetical protein